MVDIPVTLKLNVDAAGIRSIQKAIGGGFFEGMRKGAGGSGDGGSGATGAIGRAFGSAGVFGLMLKGIRELNSVTKSMFRYSPAMQGSMKMLETSFLLIMKPIGDFVGMILRPIMVTFLRFMLGPGKQLVPILAGIAGSLLAIKIASDVWKAASSAFDAIGKLPTTLSSVWDKLKSLPTDITTKLSSAWDTLRGVLNGAWQGFKDILGTSSNWAAAGIAIASAVAFAVGNKIGQGIGEWLIEQGQGQRWLMSGFKGQEVEKYGLNVYEQTIISRLRDTLLNQITDGRTRAPTTQEFDWAGKELEKLAKFFSTIELSQENYALLDKEANYNYEKFVELSRKQIDTEQKAIEKTQEFSNTVSKTNGLIEFFNNAMATSQKVIEAFNSRFKEFVGQTGYVREINGRLFQDAFGPALKQVAEFGRSCAEITAWIDSRTGNVIQKRDRGTAQKGVGDGSGTYSTGSGSYQKSKDNFRVYARGRFSYADGSGGGEGQYWWDENEGVYKERGSGKIVTPRIGGIYSGSTGEEIFMRPSQGYASSGAMNGVSNTTNYSGNVKVSINNNVRSEADMYRIAQMINSTDFQRSYRY